MALTRAILGLLALLVFLLLKSCTPVPAPRCVDSCQCHVGVPSHLGRLLKTASCSDLNVTALARFSLESVRITNTTIRQLDLFLFRSLPTLLELVLSSVGIHQITGTGKTLPRLQLLDIAGNNLHILQPLSFQDFPELVILNLTSNGLHTISPSTFVLYKLRVLDLSYNKINVLKSNYFSNLPNLQEIFLSHNLISCIPNYLFTHNLKTLDLSSNHIIRFEDRAFEGINISSSLNLGFNSLRRLPNQALKHIFHINTLILDSNPFQVLSAGSVSGLSVISLSFSYHKTLQVVHRDALFNLPFLERLQMRSNPSLTYFHPQSLIKVPNLKTLDLSDNALFTLEQDLLLSTPALDQLFVSNNSFTCHCSLTWLKSLTKEDLFCTEINNGSLVSLLELANNTEQCAPYILPLFPRAHHELVGNNVSFVCRALGSFNIELSWLTTCGHRLTDGQCWGRACVHDQTLTIRFIHTDDAGEYRCLVTDALGVSASRSVMLAVHIFNIHFVPLVITSTFVTLAWNMSNSMSNNYLLRYEEIHSGEGSDAAAFSVGLRGHSYTIHGLHPGKAYQFVLYMRRGPYSIQLASTSITTRDHDFLEELGIERRYVGAATALVAAGVVTATCIVGCAVRGWRLVRKRRRRRLSHSQSMASSATKPSVLSASAASTPSDVAFITFIQLPDEMLIVEQSTESDLMSFS